MTIKELRKAKKLSQAAFAAELGIAAVTVSQLETGRMKLSPKMATRVKDVFGENLEAAPGKETPAKKPAKASKPAKAAKQTKAAKPAKVPKPAKAPKLEIYVQSPYGGNITPEQIAAKMPEGTESCFVRVDQNLIWWVRPNGETGAVEIWNDLI